MSDTLLDRPAFRHPTDGKWHLDWRGGEHLGQAFCDGALLGVLLPDFKRASSVRPSDLCRVCFA